MVSLIIYSIFQMFVPGQHAEEAPHVVEYGERDEGRLRRQPRRVRVHHGVGGERQEGHDEHGAVPKKALEIFHPAIFFTSL